MPKTWCVQHRDGWCAIDPPSDPGPNPLGVFTKCEMTIVVTLGVEMRDPDCAECLAVLAGDDDG